MKLFDLDGTLLDSNGIWVTIDLEFLTRRGLTPTREYADEVGHSIFPRAAQFTRDYYRLDLTPQDIMDEWMEMAREAYAHSAFQKPGAADFLSKCQREGERMALVTACVPELCRTALARNGLEGYFEQLVFVQEMGLEKRNPQAFLRTAELLGVSPAACTMYEDSPGACAAAKQAGMAVVGVHDAFYASYEGEMRALCDQYIAGFPDLL